MKYGTLAHRHCDYNPWGCWDRLRLLNEGGYEIIQPTNARKFIPKAPNETDERYEYRIKFAAYVNHLASVIGYLVGSLFQAPPDVQPASDEPEKPGELPDATFYSAFSADADLSGQPFSQMLYQAVGDALLYRKALVGVDLPPAVQAENRAQEEQAGGGRAWLYRVPIWTLTDWVEGAGDQLEAAVLHEVLAHRPNLSDPPNMIVDRFVIWEMIGGQAAWAEFQTKPRKTDDPKPSASVEVEQVGETTATTFGRIPIQVLKFRKELWVGNKAGPLNEEHWRRRSELAGALGRTLEPIPFIKRGPEMGAVHGALPSETQQNPTRGSRFVDEARQKGYVAIGSDDEIGYAEPPSGGYVLGMAEKREVVEEIYRTVHAMAQSLPNTAATTQRSAESKREDRQATGVVLDAVSAKVRPFAVQLYDTIAQARGDSVSWKCHGLDSYDRDDRGAVVEEAVAMKSVTIPSVTWERAYLKAVAFATAPGLSPTEKAQVASEIDESVDELNHVRETLAGATPPGPPVEGEGEEEFSPGPVPPT